MSNDIKKIIAGLIAGGTLAMGGNAVFDRATCEYIVEYQGQEICIDEQVKEILDKQLPVSKGFGGIKFEKQQ